MSHSKGGQVPEASAATTSGPKQPLVIVYWAVYGGRSLPLTWSVQCLGNRPIHESTSGIMIGAMDESELFVRHDAAAGQYFDASRTVKQRNCEPGSPECGSAEDLGEAANRAHDALEAKRSQSVLHALPEGGDKLHPSSP